MTALRVPGSKHDRAARRNVGLKRCSPISMFIQTICFFILTDILVIAGRVEGGNVTARDDSSELDRRIHRATVNRPRETHGATLLITWSVNPQSRGSSTYRNLTVFRGLVEPERIALASSETVGLSRIAVGTLLLTSTLGRP